LKKIKNNVKINNRFKKNPNFRASFLNLFLFLEFRRKM